MLCWNLHERVDKIIVSFIWGWTFNLAIVMIHPTHGAQFLICETSAFA